MFEDSQFHSGKANKVTKFYEGANVEIVDNGLVLNSGKPSVAKRKAGQTLREIASDLNEKNIKPKRGEQWYASSVSCLIKRVTVTP